MDTRKNKIGILGGGQLAQMGIEDGEPAGFDLSVLCKSGSEPAAQKTLKVMLGDPDKLDDVVAFAKTVDIVTIESEFHDARMLAKAEKISGKLFLPSPAILKQLQDRWPQKCLLSTLGVPTALSINPASVESIRRAFPHFNLKCVFKKRTRGYDGRETFVIRGREELEKFLTDHFKKDEFIMEELVSFRHEFAVQIARNAEGETRVFPFVETVQTNYQLDTLVGPIVSPRLKKILPKLLKFLKQLDYAGIITFELFEDQNGRILVNEIAPRVHNSGHYSLEALRTSQFLMQFYAISVEGYLPEIEPLATSWAMVNIIGGTAPKVVLPEEIPEGIHLHMYGKANRKGRKLGHATLLGNSSAEALERLREFRKRIEV